VITCWRISNRLVLYVCDSCGAVSTKNFRDDSCRVCRVAMKVSQVVIEASTEWGPAPHTEESDGG
jgi:hypothetical protein